MWQVVATLTLALRLSLAAASPIAESGFSGTWASVVVASVAVAAPRLQRTGSIGAVHGLFLHRVWDLPRPGIEPVSSACRWILYHRATREPPLCILIMHIQFGKPLTWGMHFENIKITHDKIGTPAPSADPEEKNNLKPARAHVSINHKHVQFHISPEINEKWQVGLNFELKVLNFN